MKLIKTSLFALVLCALCAFRPDTEVPHKIEVNPSSPGAGENVTFTVEMTGVVDEDTTVTIGSSSSFWQSIPASVVVPDGFAYVQFQATIRTNPSGSSLVTASANGGSAYLNIPL